MLAAERPVAGAFGDIFEEADLKLLHRVAFGVTVAGAGLRPVASRTYQAIAGDLSVREYAERMREAAFVAQLALAAADPIGAAANARLAVLSSLHAAVYAHGLPFTGDKWLYERLVSDAPKLAARHASFSVLPALDADIGSFVRSAVEVTEQLSRLSLSLAAQAPGVRFCAGDLTLFPVGPDRFLVSVERDDLREVTQAQAQVWSDLGGESEWRCDPGQAGQLKLSYDLYAAGIAGLSWDRGLPVAELGFAGEEIA